MGISYGSIGNDVEDLLGDSNFSQDMFGAGSGRRSLMRSTRQRSG